MINGQGPDAEDLNEEETAKAAQRVEAVEAEASKLREEHAALEDEAETLRLAQARANGLRNAGAAALEEEKRRNQESVERTIAELRRRGAARDAERAKYGSRGTRRRGARASGARPAACSRSGTASATPRPRRRRPRGSPC